MDQDKTRDCLTRKMGILEKIAKNTGLQRRLIRKQDMRGLTRLLIERGRMIDELAAVNLELGKGEPQEAWIDLQGVMAAILAKQREILSLNDEVLQAAMEEKSQVAAAMNNSRVMREAKSHYVKQWALTWCRGSINLKG